MKIKLNTVLVNDQTRALTFYTEILGFAKQMEIPMGEYRWITVVSPEEPGGAAVSLEPVSANPAAQAYQKALLEQGIPLTAFEVSDIAGEFQRLKSRGVVFTQEPTSTGPVTVAVFSDTCGNLIQIYQQ